MTLRLYDPQTHQWSLYWATSKSGALGQPTIGEFKNGRGEFFRHRTIWSEWQIHPGSICLVGHYPEFSRTLSSRSRTDGGQNLGGQLDHGPDTSERGIRQSALNLGQMAKPQLI